jgi:hypothetical protein
MMARFAGRPLPIERMPATQSVDLALTRPR